MVFTKGHINKIRPFNSTLFKMVWLFLALFNWNWFLINCLCFQNYQDIIDIAKGVKSEYTKIDDLPQNEELQILKFQWKDNASYGTKVAVYLENSKWFYFPDRISKALTNQDPYLTMMNNKSWTITFRGRISPYGIATFDLKYLWIRK